jgi:hypothetical protein
MLSPSLPSVKKNKQCETDSALDFASDCGYLPDGEHDRLSAVNREVGRMLGAMINNPRPFLKSEDRSQRTEVSPPPSDR